MTLAVAAMASFGAVGAYAQDADDDARWLTLELNAVADQGEACRLTFLASNGGQSDIEQMVLEAVIFGQGGQVDRLTLFDFRTVPADRPRVRQFDLAGLACSDVSRVLINDATTCDGDGVTPSVCLSMLSLSSRVDVELLG